MIFRTLVLNSFKPLQSGSLRLQLPDGEERSFGALRGKLQARLNIRDENFFRRCVLYGPIGFSESYLAGEWDSPDLTKVLAWFVINADNSSAMRTRSGKSSPLFSVLNFSNRLRHMLRPNSLAKSRDNIREHYDLSNAFFRLWLDPSMTYSSAYFDPPDLDLEAAQSKKYEKLCQRLRLSPSDSVLEIGSGWGGFSIHAAKTHGCRVTTITISEQQYEEAAHRIEQAGLQDRISLQLCDYRKLSGHYDKIASIEMLEAVGDRYVNGFFAQCDALLKPRGLLGLQAILCPDDQYAILRDGVDFIQKHIFPGSLLMSMGRINEAMQKTGRFNLLDYEDMGPSYARTLRIWRENFEAALEAVRSQGYDEGFIRKWRYYLCYCEAAFGARHITVAQILYSRPNNLSLESPAYDLFS